MDSLKIARIMAFAQSRKLLLDPAVVDGCPKNELHKLERLVSITLKRNSAKVSQMDDAWFEGLDDNMKDCLKKLFQVFGTHTMIFWLLVLSSIDTAMKEGETTQEFGHFRLFNILAV